MTKPLATLAIITHDRPELRDRAIASVLRSVARCNADLPILVLDSSRTARPVPAGVHLVYRPDLPMCISKRRLAFELGTREWVIMLDDDCQVTPEAVGTLLPRLGADDFKDGAALFAVTGFTGARNWITRTALHSELTAGLSCETEADVAWGATTLSAFRRDAVLEVDGFRQENLPLAVGGEDIDVCLRLRAAGWRLRQIPDMLTLHDTQTWNSFRKNARRMRGYGSGEAELIRMFPGNARAGYENFLVSLALGSLCGRVTGGRTRAWPAAVLAGLVGWYGGELTELREQNPEANYAELAVQVPWSAAYELGRLRTAIRRRDPQLALRRFNWEQPDSVSFSWALPASVAKRIAISGLIAATAALSLRQLRRHT
jgi:hypothetical protein